MREATRRQVFGIGAGAIGAVVAGSAVAAHAVRRPNDARLRALASEFVALDREIEAIITRAEREFGTDPHKVPALAPREREVARRRGEILHEVQATPADSVVGVGHKAFVLVCQGEAAVPPDENTACFEAVEHSLHCDTARLVSLDSAG